MKLYRFLPLAFAALCLASAACSDDDSIPADPQGTVALNMLDEENGKTMLGNSGIYIDKGQNFVAGNDCNLFVIGKSGGLGAVGAKSLGTPVSKAAVQSGYGYMAVRPNALMRFPSGALAMPIGNSEINYLKFYVVASLKEGDKTTGATVKYVMAMPNTYGLPEFRSNVLTIDWDNFENKDKVALTLSDEAFEYDFHGDNEVRCEKRGRKLLFWVDEPVSGEYTLYLRIRESYTMVYVTATNVSLP